MYEANRQTHNWQTEGTEEGRHATAGHDTVGVGGREVSVRWEAVDAFENRDDG